MTNAQFAWLMAPQALLLLVILATWTKRRFEDWSSHLRYDCTAHVHDLSLRLDSLQRGQDRLHDGIEDLKRQK